MKDAVAKANDVKPEVFALVTAGKKGFDLWTNCTRADQVAHLIASSAINLIKNKLKPEEQGGALDAMIGLLQQAKEAGNDSFIQSDSSKPV